MRFLFTVAIALFFFSCGNDPVKKEPVKNTARTDAFREEVLTLQRAGLLENIPLKEMDSLIRFYSGDSLNGLKELLVRSGDMLKISTELGRHAPHEIYAAVFDTIGKHYPDLKASELHCDYLPETPSDKDTGWVLLHAKFGENSYDKTMYYLRDWPVDELMYKLYNTYLTDIGSNERLYLIQFSCNDCHNGDDFMGKLDVSHFGLMRMKKPQADSIMYLYDLEMEPVDEFALFSTAKTKATAEAFDRTGLIRPEMKAWYAQKRIDVERGSLYSMEDFFDFYDTLFLTTSFDTINDYNPYDEMLRKMALISGGQFNPEGVSDQHANPTTHTIRFSLNGKVYEQESEQHTGMLDPSVIDQVNAALEEQHVKGKFYSVFTRDTEAVIIFITDEQFPKVKASGFFPLLQPGAPDELKIRYSSLPPSAS